jgi:hypothetical protein
LAEKRKVGIIKEETRNGRRYRRVSLETWDEIKNLWATDPKYTFNKLSTEYDIPLVTIKLKSMQEDWSEHRRQVRLEAAARTQEKTVKMLVDLGMPKQAFIKMVVSRALGVQTHRNVKEVIKTRNKDGKKGPPVTLEKTILAVDNAVTYKYTDLIAQLAGWKAPPKTPIKETSPTPELDRVQGAEFEASEMTDDQAEQIYLERLNAGKK